jgi:hypothetical protein
MAKGPQLPRPSSTLPSRQVRCVAEFGRYRGNNGLRPAERPEDFMGSRPSTFFTPTGIVKCEPPLPLLLQPGRECVVTVGQTRLWTMFNFEWIARVRGVFEDQMGNHYKSPTAKVDWQSRIIT